MVTDLRAVNKVIHSIGSLQHGTPLPSLLLMGWPLIVTDLKDCFFTVSLQEHDKRKICLHSDYL